MFLNFKNNNKMNTAVAKERIKERLTEVEEEWILKSIQRILVMNDSDEANFIAEYEINLEPMSVQQITNRAMQSEMDIQAGNVSDLENLLNEITI